MKSAFTERVLSAGASSTTSRPGSDSRDSLRSEPTDERINDEPRNAAAPRTQHASNTKNPLSCLLAPSRRRVSKLRTTWTCWNTLRLCQSPDYLRDNSFIKQFYRPELNLSQALCSLFTLHNETGNIWTHLIGFVIVVVIEINFLVEQPVRDVQGSAVSTPKWPQLLCQSGAAWLFLASATCHLLCCMSKRVYCLVWKYDYASISMAQACNFYPLCYYAFACWSPAILAFYLITSGLLLVACIMGSCLDFFQAPQYAMAKAGLFASLPGWAMVPAAHTAWLYGHIPEVQIALLVYVTSCVCTLSGCALHLGRVPERILPGRFDLLGNSHQVFHIAIVGGFLLYNRSMQELYMWRSSQGHCV